MEKNVPMPHVMVEGLAQRWFDGKCSKCEGEGPVEPVVYEPVDEAAALGVC